MSKPPIPPQTAMSTAVSLSQQALSVSQLTAQIKDVVERGFTSVWVVGEISNFARPQSGHCYFSLCDDRAQIRAVIWRTTANRLKFDLTDGQHVVCHGRLEVYAPRGSYQLVIDQLEPQGVGALELALRQLRDKLEAEGLFDRSRKRPLPKFPRRLALVTSPTGAAVRDFLEVLRRRWRGVDVLVIPARVQGEGAGEEIAQGIRTANRLSPAPDVLIVARGGGSQEDLWAFNEEVVVRAIAASRIPTVSAVGHEIDVTLSDLAADVRALTPSEAAERVVPAADEVLAQIRAHQQRLLACVRRCLSTARMRLERIESSRPIRRPYDRLHELSRTLDELSARSARAMRTQLSDRQNRTAHLAGKLASLSPLAVLERGYSITQDEATGRIIRDASRLRPGQRIHTQYAKGHSVSDVSSIDPSMRGEDEVGRGTVSD